MLASSDHLSARQRGALAAGAAALMATAAMTNCAALEVSDALRTTLQLATGMVGALLASVLIEDAIGAPLRTLLVAVLPVPRPQ